MNQEQMKQFHESTENFMREVLQIMDKQQVAPEIAASAISNILSILCVKELNLDKEQFDATFNSYWESAVAHYRTNGSGVTQ
jgi:hypothetical protein